jgi:hypothetical protein
MVLVTNAMTKTDQIKVKTNTAGNQSGAKTQTHGHPITPTNFKEINPSPKKIGSWINSVMAPT